MEHKFKKAIENYYDLKILKCTTAARQFVAETYLIEDTKGNQYFCKLVDKPLFIPGIIKTLPVVEEMHSKGIDRICYPIRGAEGLYFFVDSTLVVLFNYIPASQSFDYNPFTLGKLLAEIHLITPKITIQDPKEEFEFTNQSLFDEQFEGVLASKSSDPVIQEFKKLLHLHEDEVRHFKALFQRLCKLCKEEADTRVLTHGDAATNVLVKSSDDIYIIDWDEMRLAPAERDLWMSDERPGFMEGYKSIRPDFSVNKNMRSFCILQYYFESMLYKFAEILKETADSDSRLKWVQKLAQGRMAGWRLPKMEEIKNEY